MQLKNKLGVILFCSILFLLASIEDGTSQGYNRIRADFSVKVKTAAGGQALTMGQVYYDKNIKQIIYYVTFPEPEIWLTADTVIYQIKNGKMVAKTKTFAMAEFTVFHLALNTRLQDFGLRNTQYTVGDVTREGDMVITTWAPPAKTKDQMGNILVSVKNKQLFGVVFQDPKGAVIRKQFFEEYQVFSGLAFPGKIVEINTIEGRDNYQVTTYKNITVDEMANDNKYFYNISNLHY